MSSYAFFYDKIGNEWSAKSYVITCTYRDEMTDTPMFWSNDDGWVDLQSATIFTEAERNSLDMPLGAWAWLELPTGETSMSNPDIKLLTDLGRELYDHVFPVDKRGEQWIQEDFEEAMITALTALRFFAEDVECLTWEHLIDNANDRFSTEIERGGRHD